MMDYYDHIDDYVNGLLNGAELDAFETAMAEDSDLAKAVANHDVAMDVIGSLMEDEVRGVIGEVEGANKLPKNNTNKTQKQQTKVFSIKRLAYAASFIGLLFISIWYFTSIASNQIDNRFQYAKRHLDPISEIERGTTENLDNLEEAINSFELRKWDEATLQFTKLLTIDKYNSDLIRLYLANIAFRNKKFDNTLIQLKFIQLDSKFHKKAQKLEYLTYLILDDKKNINKLKNSFPNITLDLDN